MTIPYIQSVSEEIRQVLGSVNISTSGPQGTCDKVPKGMKTNIVYQAECGQCGEKYLRSMQPLSKRVHQHTHSAAGRPNTKVLNHMCATGQVLDLDSFTILEREADWMQRGIREAIYAKQMVPGLNKSGGLRCALSPVWDRPLGVKSSSQHT